MTEVLERAVEWLRDRDGFVVASHYDPDGDSLGSSLALVLGLDQLGKTCTPVIRQPLPARYSWLPGSERIVSAETAPAGHAAAVLMECSDFQRSGVDGLDALETLNVDHHTQNAMYADVNWIDPSVAATGMMVLRLLRGLEVRVTPQIAELLYLTVLTDTGSFRHANTDAAALEFASEMVGLGARPAAVAEAVYGSFPASRVRLMAEALATLTLEDEGRIAWMEIPRAAFERHGTTDTEDVINHGQGIDTVVVTLLLKEAEPGWVRASLRSDGTVDVAELSARFGGGGHPRAAGCRLPGSLQDVRNSLLGEVRQRL